MSDLKLQKLKELKEKRKIAKELNKKAVKEVVVLQRESAKQQRKRKQAEELLQEQDYQSRGIDLERVDNLKYTIEDVEKWNEKLEIRDRKKDVGFTDFTQIAQKKYHKEIQDFTPDLNLYNQRKEEDEEFYRSANSLTHGMGNKPTEKGINQLVAHVEGLRNKRGNFSRRRAHNEDEEVTFINERNMRFNKKIERAYGKFTGEIKASFERGTAL
ncbi:hypothetical protein HDV01_003592 [Terramyces sp. JEL0728]|nr:hypothetical protein HDV01_003592 [Terramyces sp. JEL0728]